MKSRFDPIEAYGVTVKNREKYSLMADRLKPIATTYQKNEKTLRETTKLEEEDYADCIRFQDHTMEKTVCGWYDSTFFFNHHLRKEQRELEKKAKEIYYDQPTGPK